MVDIFDAVIDSPNEFWLRYKESDTDTARQIKALFQRSWLTYAKYAEKQWLVEFQGEGFFQRWWEMYLFNRLLEAGFAVTQPGPGMPDMCVEWRGGKIYIECVAPSVGEARNKIPLYESGQAHQVPRDEVVLRLTSAVDAKVRQTNKRFDSGRLTNADRCMIAVDDSRLRFSGFDSDLEICRLP